MACVKKDDNKIRIRSTKNYNEDEYIEKLNSADWSKLYLCRNVNKAWTIFQDIFIKVLDNVVPF